MLLYFIRDKIFYIIRNTDKGEMHTLMKHWLKCFLKRRKLLFHFCHIIFHYSRKIPTITINVKVEVCGINQ
jgi:hypothetical protein